CDLRHRLDDQRDDPRKVRLFVFSREGYGDARQPTPPAKPADCTLAIGAELDMNVMRYTVIDRRGAASFVGPCDALGALLIGCSGGAETLDQLLLAAERSGARLQDQVSSALAV